MPNKTVAKRPAKVGTIRTNGKPITEYEDMPIVADKTEVLFVWPTGRELGVVSISRFTKTPTLDLRRYYVSDADEWRPGKGVKVAPKDVDVLIDALVKFRDTIKEKLAE